ncbi:MAG: hypothetical protein RLZZ480_58 [Candidatus Parcubacteria bacterium]|jgi:murein DD-endopeptidase MepM/ murein hydrolase activator NlpD
MTQLSFHNKNSTRRAFLAGIGAVTGTLLLPGPATAMAARVRRQFVDEQIGVVRQIVEGQRFVETLSNRYLASGLYYSSTFLSRLAQPANQVDVPTAIIGQTGHLLTGSYRAAAVSTFESLSAPLTWCGRAVVGVEESLPLRRFSFGHGTNHYDAVDLFAREGVPVYAFASGIVLVADSGWTPHDERSAASMKGGNTVIVFNHIKNEFYRYAHLEQVSVRVGELVQSGVQVGTVGHTGTNAMRPGHGGHLHFEINRHDRKSGANYVVRAEEIRRRIGRLL